MVSSGNFRTGFNRERHSLSLLWFGKGLLHLSFPWRFPFRSGTARPQPGASLGTVGLLHPGAKLLFLVHWHLLLSYVAALVEAILKAVSLYMPPMAHEGLAIPDRPVLLHFSTEIPPVILWFHLEGVKLMVVRGPLILSSFLIPPGLLCWWTI